MAAQTEGCGAEPGAGQESFCPSGHVGAARWTGSGANVQCRGQRGVRFVVFCATPSPLYCYITVSSAPSKIL